MDAARRFALRAACVWVALGSLAMFFALIERYPLYRGVWAAIVPFVGHRVFGVEGEIVPRMTGSGDSMFAWLQSFCELALALAVAAVWLVIDRRHRQEARLAELLRVSVRYSLAWTMLGYGVVKVFKTQFPFPSGERLLQPYGESSPMALLWTFMGYSTPYNIFAGALECVGALLLLFRRTTTLGALILLGVLANVVMLNLCYDVPVKLYSIQLFAMACLLAGRDARRLLDLLMLNRGVSAGQISARLPWPRLEALRPFVKGLLICAMLYKSVASELEYRAASGPDAPPPPHFGVWEVESFVAGGVEHPPLTTDPVRWRAVSVTRNGRLIVVMMDGTMRRFNLTQENGGTRLVLKSVENPEQQASLLVTADEGDTLTLAGPVNDVDLVLALRRRELADFPLVARGFHWVNEFPHNR